MIFGNMMQNKSIDFNGDNSRNGAVFLRFIAIVLVINSHMDEFYPLQWLATGGAIGNSLFFMLSAYGLLLSEKNIQQSFTEYFIKRIKKIYPAVWVNIVLFIIPITALYFFTSPYWYAAKISEFNFNDPLVLLGVIFYPPNAYWFLQALMLFYLMGFFFIKNYTIRKIGRGFLTLLVLYAVCYVQFADYSTWVTESTLSFKMIFYAMVFLSGIYFASINDQIIYRGKRDWFLLFLLLFAIYLHKFVMLKGITGEFQFIEQLLIFPVLYFFLKVSKSGFILETLMKLPYVSAGISIIAAMTLELYMVHGPARVLVHQYIATFPANVILHLLITLIISYGLYRFNQYLLSRMSSQIMGKRQL